MADELKQLQARRVQLAGQLEADLLVAEAEGRDMMTADEQARMTEIQALDAKIRNPGEAGGF